MFLSDCDTMKEGEEKSLDCSPHVPQPWLRGSLLQLEFDTHRSNLPNILYAVAP